jgi:glycosyltransferase involved in cell wall biosynthesis
MLDSLIRLLAAKRSKHLVLEPDGRAKGAVAISYLTWPLVEGWDSPRARGHTNAFEVAAMAKAWQQQGFRVEVCDHTDREYRPPPDCRVAIDIHGNLERWQAGLPRDCLKILHATGCHWRFQNLAEAARLDGVSRRRGVALKPRRQVPPSRAADCAERIVVLGNAFTAGTFSHAKKPVSRIPISSAYEFVWPDARDFERAKQRFLWIGSYGMVHKGLDLVLEAFADLPAARLTICGRPDKEEDFYRLYRKQLEGATNIDFLGWTDLFSPVFAEIAHTHGAVIYPSCAEGGGGAVIHCMHAGMIPICTEEASVDLEDFGLRIAEGSVAAVTEAVEKFASLQSGEVESRARSSYEHVRNHHRRHLFAAAYREFVAGVERHLT